ncbi:MAG: tRNA (cytidine(34)-2'-O)-methyltransferase [Eubacterium sp.]|nr:tRNA (cytidine(34)-2'-O)-methyltransferase [Eubacterium sp.]
MLNVILHEPEIPFNTGAIGRTCVATNTALHMIEPFGFILSDRNIKRAGMDYWEKLNLTRYTDYEDFLDKHREICFAGNYGGKNCFSETECGESSNAEELEEIQPPHLWYATTKARQTYADVRFGPDDFIMFGKESAGIPEEILVLHPEACIRIPMWGDTRSLNLSNSVAIILYEALRQNGFDRMARYGNLHHLSWDSCKQEK